MEITVFLGLVGAVLLVTVVLRLVSRGSRAGGGGSRPRSTAHDAGWIGGTTAGAWYGTSGDSSSGWGGGDLGGGGGGDAGGC
jgi:uncharacterized protein